jgi:transposase InsO family protein
MTQDDVLFSYRLQLFDLAARTTVSNACRTFGVHRSTYYRWKQVVDRQGLEMLRPRERRRPVMPNRLPMLIEERIVGFSLGHPGLGPKRIAAQLRRSEWGGLIISANGVWKVLLRHGINTRAKRLALIAGYRAPYQPPSEPEPEPHIEVQRPGQLVGVDCFFVGRLRDTKGSIWQLTAIDCYSSYAWAELVRCPDGRVAQDQTSRLVQRVARELKRAGWELERVLSDNGTEFSRSTFTDMLSKLGTRHSRIHGGRPQTNGHVERLHRTILEECWRPAFARYLYLRYRGLQRELDTYLRFYNHERVHTGRLTNGAVPAELVYGGRKMESR